MKIGSLLAFLTGVLCISSVTLTAQNTLDEVKVTASKYFTKQSQTGKSITVIPDSVILDNQGKNLSQLLSSQVGIQVLGYSQSPGSIKTIYTRGAAGGLTLILLDGVPVYDPSSIEGSFDINLIPLSSVERIEIIRGGQSSLYGSDAVAGLINIITKKSNSEKLKFNSGINLSSFPGLGLNAALSGKSSRFSYQITGNLDKSKGFSSAEVINGEKDKLFNSSVFLNTNYEMGKINFRLGGALSSYRNGLDASAFTDDKDFDAKQYNQSIKTGVDVDLKNTLIIFNYIYSYNRRNYIDDSTDIPENAFNYFSYAQYQTHSDIADVYFKRKFGRNLNLLFGADWRKQNTEQSYFSISSFGPFTDTPIDSDLANISNSSVYTDWNLILQNGFGLELGGRLNHHSIYKNKSSWSVNPFWQVNQNIKLFGTISSSFKNPSLYHLFSIYGSTDLKPEVSINRETGLRLNDKLNQKSFQIIAFERKVGNLFYFLNLNEFPYGKYVNIGRQVDRGLEVEAQISWSKMAISSNYTLLNGKQVDQGSFTEAAYNLQRRPRHQANFTYSFKPIEKWFFLGNIKLIGNRNDLYFDNTTFESKQIVLPGYAVINLRAQYQVNAKLKVFSEIRNLANKHYNEVYGYSSEPINVLAGIFFGN